MTTKMFYPLFLCLSIVLLFSCSKETASVEIEEKEEMPRVTPRESVSDALFIAPLRWRITGFCTGYFGSCNWGAGDGCAIMYNGDVEEGLVAIEELELADALLHIETYQEDGIIGLNFIGFSSQFLEGAEMNEDDGTVFRVTKSVKINEETTAALGYESITIQRGEYSFFINDDTGEKMVYVDAELE